MQRLLTRIEQINEELQLDFYPEEHRYFFADGELCGLTQVIKQIFPFHRDTVACAVAKNHGVEMEDIIETWNRKRDFGSYVHWRLERLLLSDWETTDNQDLVLKQTVKPILDQFSFIGAEVLIGCPLLGLATKIDYLGQDKEGNLVTINYKTSKLEAKPLRATRRGKKSYLKKIPDTPFGHLQIQSHLERIILEKQYGIQVDKVFGLSIGNEEKGSNHYVNNEHFLCDCSINE